MHRHGDKYVRCVSNGAQLIKTSSLGLKNCPHGEQIKTLGDKQFCEERGGEFPVPRFRKKDFFSIPHNIVKLSKPEKNICV